MFGTFTPPHCGSCPFAEGGKPRHKPVLATLPSTWNPQTKTSDLLTPVGTLLGESPGPAEVDAGVPFAGRAGAELDDALAAAGIRRAQLAVLNATACRPVQGAKAADMRKAARCCRPLLRSQLRTAYRDPLNPATETAYLKAPTMALGSLANFAWHKLFKNKKPPSIKLGRGFVRRNLIVSWHPTFAFFYDPWRRGELEADLARFGRLIRGEVKLLDATALLCQPNEREILRLLMRFADEGEAAVDIETGPQTPDRPWTGKQPGYARLRTIGIGNTEVGFSIVPRFTSPRALAAIRSFLSNPSLTKIVMNGLAFDVPVLSRHGFKVL